MFVYYATVKSRTFHHKNCFSILSNDVILNQFIQNSLKSGSDSGILSHNDVHFVFRFSPKISSHFLIGKVNVGKLKCVLGITQDQRECSHAKCDSDWQSQNVILFNIFYGVVVDVHPCVFYCLLKLCMISKRNGDYLLLLLISL